MAPLPAQGSRWRVYEDAEPASPVWNETGDVAGWIQSSAVGCFRLPHAPVARQALGAALDARQHPPLLEEVADLEERPPQQVDAEPSQGEPGANQQPGSPMVGRLEHEDERAFAELRPQP